MTRRLISHAMVALATLTTLCFAPVHAGVFDDDDARKAILDLNARVNANQQAIATRLDKVENSQLELANQIDALREDIAKLRGEIELLNNAATTQDKRAKDYYTDLDSRLRKLEPQQVTVDGRSGSVDVAEQNRYDSAVAQFKSSNFKDALAAFIDFSRDYSNSVYLPAAQYYVGACYYAQRDYKSAIAAQQVVIKNWPDSPRAADAMFNIASAEADMGDKRAAKKTLESLVAAYPDSQAAGIARERLVSMR